MTIEQTLNILSITSIADSVIFALFAVCVVWILWRLVPRDETLRVDWQRTRRAVGVAFVVAGVLVLVAWNLTH